MWLASVYSSISNVHCLGQSYWVNDILCCLQVTQHGACLGLGLAGLGSGDDEVFEDLKNVLYLDSAVAGEAAGLALGLLHVGTATEKAGEMLAYAHDTQHEKVLIGCCLLLQVAQLYGCVHRFALGQTSCSMISPGMDHFPAQL